MLSLLCWCFERCTTMLVLYDLRIRWSIVGISWFMLVEGGVRSICEATETRVGKSSWMICGRISAFWRNLDSQ
jgi:hypothetical protein